MSLEQLEADTTQLPLLLAFLNPDGILMDFLDAGKTGLTQIKLQDIIGNTDRFFEALGELERSSLISRQTDHYSGQRITIHRLVQRVIKDEMHAEQFSEMTDFCEPAFPS